MKSYEEMTVSVISRAKAQKQAQKRRRGNLMIAAACTVCVAFAVIATVKTNLSTSKETANTSRLSLFCVTANAAVQPQQMVQGEKVPYHSVIRIRDITGADELELVKLRREDKEYAEQLSGQNPEELPGNPEWSVTTRITDHLMISTIFTGSFYMEVDDYNQVKDVSVTTTEIGWAAKHIADYHDATLKDGIGITWSLSEAGVDKLEENPEMKLSELSDTIAVTVTFADGSEETVEIRITVDDDGQIYGTFVGNNVEV